MKVQATAKPIWNTYIPLILAITLGGLLLTPGVMADTRTVNVTYDTHVDSYLPDTNYATESSLAIRNQSSRKAWVYAYVDLTGLSISYLQGANLTLIKNGVSWSGSCDSTKYIENGIYDVSAVFNVSTLTYNYQPCGTTFDQSANCNLTADRFYNSTCNDWIMGQTITVDITGLVNRSVSDDGIVRFAIFPTFRNGTYTDSLAFGYGSMDGSKPMSITLAGNFTWIAPTTTTVAPGISDPSYDLGAQLGYTGGAAMIANLLVTPMIWAFLGCVGVSGYVAYKLGHDQAIVFLGLMVGLITLLTIFGIFPIWIVILEIIVGAFLLGSFLLKGQGGS